MAASRIRYSIVALALVLGGCGFQPLYGDRGNGGSISARLAGVEVSKQNTRLGQLVRNDIVSHISPAGTNATSAYRLDFVPTSQSESLIDARDTESRRLLYRLNVSFVLTRLSTGKQVFSGKSFSNVSYDRVHAPVSNLQSLNNAQERAARIIGQDIRTRLAAYFNSHN